MNAHQRRKAIRARTHFRCDLCNRFRWATMANLMIGCGSCRARWRRNTTLMPGYVGIMVWRNPERSP